MRPLPSLRTLGRGCVSRELAAPSRRWFVYFPAPLHYLQIGFVHRSPQPWVIASADAPRWAGFRPLMK